MSTGEARTHELFLSGESLARGAVPTLGTIIHELAHAYAKANDIQDTSNRGRYHNKRFKEVAEQLGIIVEQAPTIGWSVTTVPAGTATYYEREVKALDAALTAYRVGALPEMKPVKKPTAKWFLVCPGGCITPVPVSKKVALAVDNREVIATCGSCDTALDVEKED